MQTRDNLKAAFAGESQANRKYLAFAIKAEQEGYPVMAGEDREALHIRVVRGHTVFGEPPEKCPVSGAKQTTFRKVA